MAKLTSGKIVATVGPATSNATMLEEMMLSGVNVFRLNFSHGDHKGHSAVYEAIRSLSEKHSKYPSILADLQGPKLRVGTFENDSVFLETGSTFVFDMKNEAGNASRVTLPHPEIFQALKPGSILLLDDGKLRMQVIEATPEKAEVKVIVGGKLSNRKGVNVHDVMLDIPALTEKDINDLNFALQLGVDWVALSFVQKVEDIQLARTLIGNKAGIISKLEKPMAIADMDNIIDATDAVMVARGDLGVEMNPEEVPGIQKKIIKTCHRLGKPVIVATQMLESMISSPSATRAEISDIATAVNYGADATMLSAESASGSYPIEAISTMHKVIKQVEKEKFSNKNQKDEIPEALCGSLDSVCYSAKIMAEYSSGDAIIIFSNDSKLAKKCSRLRPAVPIFYVTENESSAVQTSLYSGIYPAIRKAKEEDFSTIATEILTENNLISDEGNLVVFLTETGAQLKKINK